mgnify:CR=1 FL=1
MKIFLTFLLSLCAAVAFSQADRIELGYQTTKRGIEWVRPGMPTHIPAWRVSRDTNAIIWHDKSTGMRYDFSYQTETWFARGTFSSTLPPLPTQTSGTATIDNRTGFWLNASNVLHRYDKTQTAWVPFKMSYQSAAPTNVSAGVSNGAAVYTTSLWQDSDDGAVYYWDGSAWQPLTTAVTNLTYTGTSSPLTLNSSTGSDVTHTAGTGISLAGSTSNMTITNTLPDVTVSLTGAGIVGISGTYPNFTITGTEVDGSTTNELQTISVSANTTTLSNSGGSMTIAGGGINSVSTAGTTITVTGTEVDGSVTNEGALTVAAGTSTTSVINSNTSGSTGVTLTAGTGLSIAESGNVITLANTLPDVTVSLTGGGIVGISGTYPNFTITGTEVDGSTTNELQTISVSANTTTLSNSGGSMTIAGGGINSVSTAGTTITVTGTEVDGSVTNEGALTVAAGTSTTSVINSNTSGSTGVTLTAGTGLSIAESGNVITLANTLPDVTVSLTGGGIVGISGTYPNFTITGTEVDGSVTNEAQTLSVTGTTSGTISLSTAGGAGGGSAVIAAGTGITVAQSGGTITITNASPGTAGWLLDGNTITAAKRIGSNDNFDVVVETNNTDRMWFDNGGAVSVGTTQSTAAQFVVNGLLSANGILVAGGGTLTGPTFYAATGSGSGSNATILSGVVNMLNGNVEGLFSNTATTGTGGALLTLSVNAAASGDAKTVYTTGTTTFASGIDNSISGEPWKLTANSDLGAATPAISATTGNKVGINQAAAVVTLQVTGTDAVGIPSGTIAQRSAAAIPQVRHNNTFSGFELYDPNKNYWYRITGVSTPSVTVGAASGSGASAGTVAGAGSNDVRGSIEISTGGSGLSTGTLATITYSNAFSGTATNVILTPKNDAAANESNKWRVGNETQNGFIIYARAALTAGTTYRFNYSVGQ